MVSMSELLIAVPDSLGEALGAVESLFAVLHASSTGNPIALDLTPVTWIRPYSAISLLGVYHYLKQLTHLPVRLTGPQCDINIYLRRIDFFKCGTGTVYITDPFNPIDNLSRRTSSSNVLELFPIRVHEDVYDTGVG